jgi:hypothetical protein
MTNPPLFDYRNACGCWWVVTNYLYGECEGGLSRVLMLHVSSPTHHYLITEMLVVVGGLSRNIYMAHVMMAYQGC